MVSFGLYHPQMPMPELGKDVAAEYTKRTKNEPNRLIFQAADSLLLIVDAIKQAKSADPKAIDQGAADDEVRRACAAPSSSADEPGTPSSSGSRSRT